MNSCKVRYETVVSVALVLVSGLLLAGCGSRPRVGEMRSESRSVEVGDAKSVRVEINMGAGNLEVTGGAEKLLEADFTYNVARLKPEVEYKNGTLFVRQPETRGLPALRGISDYRNEWGLRLADDVPMDLSVDVGAGVSDLRLAGMSLTGLDVNLGAGEYTVDLSGDWARDLDVTIQAGVGNVTLRLPRNVGARVEIEDGPHTVETSGLAKHGNTYTNAAYGASAVTLQVDLEVGLGQINVEVDGATARAN